METVLCVTLCLGFFLFCTFAVWCFFLFDVPYFHFWFFLPIEQLLYGFEHDLEICVVFFFHCLDFALEVFVCSQHIAEPCEGSHDLDVDLNGWSLLRTLDNIATPCSVKAIGIYRRPPQLEVTICDLKFSNSFLLSSNIKSVGKRPIFRRTACFKTFVCTPYSSARSRSNMTF